EASGYAIPGEYHKMMSDIGARNIGAFTMYELTVYVSDIPSSELKKWLTLEINRFGDIALRLFHTEIETMWEEGNMYQDRDAIRAEKILLKGLFPTHPLGGTPGRQQLENRSMVDVLRFKDAWYVPNNMAICLSGDLDRDKTIKMIDETFGQLKSKPLPESKQPVEAPATEPVIKEINGQAGEMVLLGYRCGGIKSEDRKYIHLISNILYNGQAGLIDIDLIQEQKVLSVDCQANFISQYGYLIFNITPNKGQTLEQAEELVMNEIEKVKNGEFPQWMPEAIANQYRLSQLRDLQDNWRVFQFATAFANKMDWSDELDFANELEKITSKEIVKFANDFFRDNYVVVYKRKGEAEGIVKVEKPAITPIIINRDAESEFYTGWKKISSDPILPEFVDFATSINTTKLQGDVELSSIKNEGNELFSLYYIIEAGKSNDLRIPIALNYLPYIGSLGHSATELKQELFRYGLATDVSSQNNRSILSISGLNRNLEKGVSIMEEILTSSVADTSSYRQYTERLIRERDDARLNPRSIVYYGLTNLAMYGNISPYTDMISNEKLMDLDPGELTSVAGGLFSYPHRIFYYGPDDPEKVESVIRDYHVIPAELTPIPEAKKYPELDITESIVLFADYDMSQVRYIMITKGSPFSKELFLYSQLFFDYYGNGESMSSVVFQEIREALGAAYFAAIRYNAPVRMDQSFYIQGIVSTQSDKLELVASTMNHLLNNLVENQSFLDISRRAIRNSIATERIKGEDLYFRWLNYHDLGINYDIRKDLYEMMDTVSMEDLRTFFNTYVKGRPYAHLIVGNLNDIDKNVLNNMGEVKLLSLKEIFGY
ncbi:MAG: insulinase family protein, partial [Bacteroidales bacterium]|nr:insulinase family protein [Bacteroidales bacterium]